MIYILKLIHYFYLMFFENCREMCLSCVYHLDTAIFLLTPGLAWQIALKKTEVKLGLILICY